MGARWPHLCAPVWRGYPGSVSHCHCSAGSRLRVPEPLETIFSVIYFICAGGWTKVQSCRVSLAEHLQLMPSCWCCQQEVPGGWCRVRQGCPPSSRHAPPTLLLVSSRSVGILGSPYTRSMHAFSCLNLPPPPAHNISDTSVKLLLFLMPLSWRFTSSSSTGR